METDEILTPGEAAALLRVPLLTLTRWRRNGAGPSALHFDKRTVRYRRSSVEAFLREIESRTTEDAR